MPSRWLGGELKGELIGVAHREEGKEPLCMVGDKVACRVGGEEVTRASGVEDGGPLDGHACRMCWGWTGACWVAAKFNKKSKSGQENTYRICKEFNYPCEHKWLDISKANLFHEKKHKTG